MFHYNNKLKPWYSKLRFSTSHYPPKFFLIFKLSLTFWNETWYIKQLYVLSSVFIVYCFLYRVPIKTVFTLLFGFQGTYGQNVEHFCGAHSIPDLEIVGQPVSEADRKFWTLQKVLEDPSFLWEFLLKALQALMISARKYDMSSIIVKTFCQKCFKSIVFVNLLQNGDLL